MSGRAPGPSTARRRLVAIVVGGVGALFLLSGIAGSSPALGVLGVVILLLLGLALNLANLRQRIPLVNSRDARTVAAGWAILAFTGLGAVLAAVPSGPAGSPAGSTTPVPLAQVGAPPTFTAGPTANVEATVQARVQDTVQALPPTATLVPPTAAPTTPPVAPTAAVVPLVVVGAGVEGVSIRKTPGTGERIKAWPDGAEMAPLGEQQQASGRSWTKVRDPDGNEGWIAADFLVLRGSVPPAAPAPVAPSKPAAAPTPAPLPPTTIPAPVVPPKPAPAPPPPPPPPPAPAPAPAPPRACCRVCTTGKACGDTCIAANRNCSAGVGCACNGWAPDAPPDLLHADLALLLDPLEPREFGAADCPIAADEQAADAL